MICSHKKYYCHKKCIFELVFFETLILIEHKKSKNTSLTMITYIFFLRKDISNLQYWWSYVWNQQRINANMLCSETLNALRARLRRLTDSTSRISSQTDQMIFSAYGTCENKRSSIHHFAYDISEDASFSTQPNPHNKMSNQSKCSIDWGMLSGYHGHELVQYSYVCHMNMQKVIRI